MKIGIIGAMEPEVALLKAQMTVERTYDQARMQFVEGLLGDVSVVVVQSGIGKVNAAACTQILIDTFAVTHVINTGIAGLLNPELQVGDIVISSDLIQHDMNVGPLNFAAGQIPGLPVFSFTADEGQRSSSSTAGYFWPRCFRRSVCKFIRVSRPHLHNVWC